MIFETKRQVRYAETGIAGKLKPVSIFNYLQDIASEHTAELKVSAWDLLPMGLAWVVFRYHLQIHQYPLWKDRILIRTWRYPFQRLYELRAYEIYDESRNLLIEAKSSWILTNLKTKRPVRIDRNLPDNLLTDHMMPIENDLAAIGALDGTDSTKIFQTRMHDLDFNKHVNNSVYAVWAIESVPLDILAGCYLRQIDINYIGESLHGDRIQSSTRLISSNPSQTFLHSLTSEQSGREITRVKTIWANDH